MTPLYRENNENIQEILNELHVPETEPDPTGSDPDPTVDNTVNVPIRNVISDTAAVNPAIILPEGTRRRRTVRFNLP